MLNSFKGKNFWGLGATLLFILGLVYFSYVNKARLVNYSVFQTGDTVSWLQAEGGYFRKMSHRTFDTVLPTVDEWKEIDLSFELYNPINCGFMFHFEDMKNFKYVYFLKKQGAIVYGENDGGQIKSYKAWPYKFPPMLKPRFQIEGDTFRFWVDGKKLMEQEVEEQKAKLGLVIAEVKNPPTLFKDVALTGVLGDGTSMSTGDSHMGKVKVQRNLLVVLLLIMMVAVSWYLSRAYELFRKGEYATLNNKFTINMSTVMLIHLATAVFIFWPFVSKGHVTLFSSDNFGEIFPLYFFSKHNFYHILSGESLALWNPLTHNGMPFYTNHWSMIYYPINWLVFLAPDQHLMTAVTFRTFMEVFLMGVCAHGFFKIELGNDRWALFSSIAYQLCSLLIFTFTIFPCTSLFFAMTVYLYFLWSMPQRARLWNFVFLTFSVILILTAANVAFTFYGVLALAVCSIYRLLTVEGSKKKKKEYWTWLIAASLVGFLITSVRMIPCLMGILDSNRIVENFYTIQDRIFLIVRLFIPEIVGWSYPGGFNALTSHNWGLNFESLDLPSNSQNTFFIYFGVIPAMLLLLNLFIRTKGKHTFWKGYAFVVLAISLLVQPAWGFMSILFFPLNHYSYHTIIVPVGLCALFGHTGLYIERSNFQWKTVATRFIMSLILISAFVLVMIAYLFPILTLPTRTLFALMIAWIVAYGVLRRSTKGFKVLVNLSLYALQLIVVTLFFLASSVILINSLPAKATIIESVMIPFSLLFVILAATAHFIFFGFGRKKLNTKTLIQMGVGIGLAAAIILGLLNSPLFEQMIGIEKKYQVYLSDMLFAHLKLFSIIMIALFCFYFYKAKRLSAKWMTLLIIFVTAFDLMAFNARFDNVVAPPPISLSFASNKHPYSDISDKARRGMDLVNYRADALDKGAVNANKGMIYEIPTYTGIMGYMPKRFSDFISHFGYSKEIILIYPRDHSENERFLDISAVKYRFKDKDRFIERPNALSRLMLFYDYKVFEDDDQVLSILKNEKFDPKKALLLSEKVMLTKTNRAVKEMSKTVLIQESTRDYVKAEVVADKEGMLLFADSYDEGWKAYVDGRLVPVIRANFNFMSAPVGQGRHIVEFKYEPKAFFFFLWLSIAGLLIWIAGIVFLARNKLKLKGN